MRTRVVLTFDIDGLRTFHRSERLASDPFLEEGIPRLAAFLRSAGVEATMFLVGRNVLDFPDLHRELADFDLGNHTLTHPRHLSRLPPAEKRREILDADAAIERVLGRPPRAFRAPHYDIDAECLDVLGALGYTCDSSLLRVGFPFDYALHAWRQRRLATHPLELPLSSLLVPVNGTMAVNDGFTFTRLAFAWLRRRRRTLVLNFHEKDFTRLPIPERRRLWNRERAPEITERFLRRILDTCEVVSVRQLLAVR